ncbi:MAG: class I SAM-dependent methyltransferase [Acidimicrobiales bacterium]
MPDTDAARRGRRFWSARSSGSGSRWGERRATPIRALIVDMLHLRPGERVLDIGCGDGGYISTLRDQVGPSGQIVGLDYSTAMIERAQRRITEKGWANVESREADLTTAHLEPATYDAALAVFSLSAMTDVPAAIATSYAALKPGGRLFVIDLHLVPGGMLHPVIRLIRQGYATFAGGSKADVLGAVRAAFDGVEMHANRKSTAWPPVATFVALKRR